MNEDTKLDEFGGFIDEDGVYHIPKSKNVHERRMALAVELLIEDVMMKCPELIAKYNLKLLENGHRNIDLPSDLTNDKLPEDCRM